MPNLLSYLRGAYGKNTGRVVSHNGEWVPRTAPIILDWVVTIITTYSTIKKAVTSYNNNYLICNKERRYWLYYLLKIVNLLQKDYKSLHVITYYSFINIFL